MYQAITFFDLDGTLLDEHSQVTPDISEAMLQLRKNKILPIIATGRSEAEIQEIKQAANIDSSVTMNGMLAKVGQTIVQSKKIDPLLCKRLMGFAKHQEEEVAFLSEDNVYISGLSEYVKQSYAHFNLQIPDVHSSAYEEDPTNMMLVLSDKNDHQYQKAFPELTFYRNGPFCIDVVNAGVTKGHGVNAIKEFLGYQDIPTFAFGDGINDLGLFDSCDTKIAMGNGLPEVLECADYVTAKNTENGIIKALMKFNLL
ncbi:haloacid dehalogenase [Enterococcus florum]|uniref:Haloacid dehalogenase n=1 Tax=Enterococcus florum TaxID=2480627 RepID=A0A4P5PJG5_9ENTE|nr:Cof-type HAD-IIB family hydrolase [Enterococcus florum]GCF95732.1 haloacid dehalogenase [Enterococcus florum]